MGTQREIVEINGKKYDATTGKLLHVPHNTPAKHHKGGTMDGVVSSRHRKKSDRHKTPAHASKPIQKSGALMRSAVKKPGAQPKQPSPTSPSLLGVNKQRQRKAAHVKQNPMISHFGTTTSDSNSNPDTSSSSVVKKVQHMPVVKHPDTKQSKYTKQQPKPSHHATKRHNAAAAKMIEKALASANSHEQPPVKKHKKRRRLAHKLGVSARAAALSSTVLAGVLLGGFYALQNIPNLSMRVAAARAGFDATMPGYSPAGFSFKGPINYSPGQVTISFQSNNDERKYTLTQQSSNWNSDSLLANFVIGNSQQYQTYLDRGRTLYIYGESNATWVDSGVWYQIEGESQMNTDQLIRIAASL